MNWEAIEEVGYNAFVAARANGATLREARWADICAVREWFEAHERLREDLQSIGITAAFV